MFVGDEVRLEVDVAAAAERLTRLAADHSIMRVSHEAWAEGITRVGPLPGISKLVCVRFMAPTCRGSVTSLPMRWEATGMTGRIFPVMDANLTLIPDGDAAALLGLDGVYGPPGGPLGESLDRAFLHRVAAATTRSFLTRIAAAISVPLPAGAASQPC